MRTVFLLLAFCCLNINVFSQNRINRDSIPIKQWRCITIGILEGGGSMVGVDFEQLATDRIGFQAGAGLFGFGAGVDFHLKPTIRSSFLSLQYWHQGFGTNYTQSLLGPAYVFRGKKWFTFQIGLGFALEKGPAWTTKMDQPPIMLTYAIGAYIPR